MNKRIAVAVLGLMVLGAGRARAVTYATGNLVNETGLAYNNTYVLNVDTFSSAQGGVGRVAVQVIYGSNTATASTFNGGRQSTATITVVNNALLAGVKASNKITVPTTANILAQSATAQVTLSSPTAGLTLFVNGNRLQEGIEWTGVNLSSHVACINLSVAINTYLASTLVSTCPLTSGVIYTTATTAGPAANSYTVTSTSITALSTGSLTAPFSGGRPGALTSQWISFNGDKVYNGIRWTDASGQSSMTALSIAQWLNSYGIVTATVPTNSSIIYTTAAVEGAFANAYTLSASTTNLVISSSNYTGGQDTVTFSINGLTLSGGTQGPFTFAIGTTVGASAINIASAIANTPALAAIVQSTTIGGGNIIFATSTAVGTSTNYAIVVSTALAINNGGFISGANSAYGINLAPITIPNHGYTTGFQVGVSTGSGVQLKPLTTGTSYYVIRLDGNNIALATSLVNAVAGSSITITSSSTLTTAPTFTLQPVLIGGNPSWKWQVSNDAQNWTDLSTQSSYTVSTYVFPSTSTATDFGDVDYQYLRLNVTAPTSGGISLKVPVNGRL